MAVKIRLARKGRKKQPFYHIVVADSRAPRDGRYIERIGYYNPIPNPAVVELDFDKALDWLQKGALPTDTCRWILSKKGVLLKKHLLEGVKKGAFDEAEAEKRFQKWLNEAESKAEAKINDIAKAKEKIASDRLAAEKKVNEALAAKLAEKRAAAAQAEAEAAAAAVAEEASEEDATQEGEESSEVAE